MKAQENERSSTEHLIDGYPEENFDKPLQHREIVGKHSRSYSTVVLILLLLYFSTVETSNLALRVRSTKQQKNEYFVPQSALRYQQRPEWSELRYPWNLPPSDALDSVWEDLLSGQNVKVTEEELISSTPNVTNPIQTVDGGYVGVIGVYHHLHCLDIIRRVTHWDHYGPRASSYELKEGILTVEHADHCIDSIRQAVMCHANTALYAGHWISSEKGPKTDIDSASGSSHKCVDWGSFTAWVRPKAIARGEARYRPRKFPGSNEGIN